MKQLSAEGIKDVAEVQAPTADEIAAREAFRTREEFKLQRAKTVLRSTITTASGNTFNADESSQQRMARAVIIATETGQIETNWTLADNSVVLVSKSELVEALSLSAAAQSAVWVQA